MSTVTARPLVLPNFIMRTFIVLALFVAAATAAAVSSDPKSDTITRFDVDNIGVDGYNFAYETSGGIAAEERGVLKNAGSENEGIEVSGSYSYLAPDGEVISVKYVANEGGFQPQGDHLPVVP